MKKKSVSQATYFPGLELSPMSVTETLFTLSATPPGMNESPQGKSRPPALGISIHSQMVAQFLYSLISFLSLQVDGYIHINTHVHTYT